MTKMNVVNQKKQDYYTICNITDSIFQINMHNHVFSYLLIGNQKALLIDTGWGTVDIKSIAESLTSLPLIVVNTHGHLDHIYGNYLFDEIYIKEEDAHLIGYDYTKEKREYVMSRFGQPELPKGMTLEDWKNAKPSKILSLNSLKYFDLGDRIVDIIDIAGHTIGSVGFIDRKEKILFTGDSVKDDLITLHFNMSTNLQTYLNSINNLIDIKDRFVKMYSSHTLNSLDPEFLFEIKNAVSQIIKGEIEGLSKDVYGRNCLVCDFKSFSISYRENSI